LRGNFPIRKRPSPQEPPRTLGIGLLQGPRGVHFLVSEVPLYAGTGCIRCSKTLLLECGASLVTLPPKSGILPATTHEEVASPHLGIQF
jgi:hypothetical protein